MTCYFKYYIMRNFLLIWLLLAGVIVTSCKDEKDFTSGLEPMEVKLSLSHTGEQFVELTVANPTYSFNIMKNYPIYSTTATLTAMSQDELGETYTTLEENQYSIESPELTIGDSEREHEVVITFKNVMNLDPDLTYAIGLKLDSSSKKVGVDENRNKIIITLRLGEIGTMGNPYVLSSAEDLLGMKAKCKKDRINYFKLGADIDMDGVTWTPLCPSAEYKLNFDGDNHTIKNLTCGGEGVAGPSFFGILCGTCENLKFENANITSVNEPTGVVAASVGLADFGIHESGSLKNVHVLSGTVRHNSIHNAAWWWSSLAGGLCGNLAYRGSLITECSANVNVTGSFVVGGLVGEANSASMINKSYASGDVHSTTGFAGGLVGNIFYTTISDCYATGKVSNPLGLAAGVAGGLVGRTDRGAEVDNCYSMSPVEACVNGGGIIACSGFNQSGKNYVVGCVAWNPTLVAKNSNNDCNTGRICGFMQGPSSDGICWGENCYARADMSVTINDEPVTKNEQSEMNTSGGASLYEGRNATNLISVTRDVLKWSTYIWDFSGDRPVFIWEKNK